MDKIPAIIVDIDGTIADCSHRLHFIEWDKKDWDGFYQNLSEDKPKQDIIDLINNYLFSKFHHYELFWWWDTEVIFITGRSDKYAAITDTWLRKHFTQFSYELFMRTEWDFRQDYEIKKEIYENEIKDKYDVKYVFEDRDQVVKIYRELWLTVLQVANGNF